VPDAMEMEPLVQDSLTDGADLLCNPVASHISDSSNDCEPDQRRFRGSPLNKRSYGIRSEAATRH